MKDSYIIDLVLGHNYIWNNYVNCAVTQRYFIYKRKILDCKHQNALVDILILIQKHYYKSLYPLYFHDYKLKSKKYKQNLRQQDAAKKTLNTLCAKINKYRLKHWYWQPINLSQLR